MSRKRIVLHGTLKKLCPQGTYECEAETAADAIKAFSFAFKKFLMPTPVRPRLSLRAVGYDNVDDLFCPTDHEEIHLVQSFHGGKNGGWIQIALGVVLIIIGAVLSWFGGSGVPLILMGAAMIAGGIISVLSPAPKRDNARTGSDPDSSKYLGAPKNTVAIGTRIGMGWGMFRVYGHYISFDVDAKDMPL
jgi:predicted phage tail protein